jgi:2-keto-4-pentenoate hydratase
MTALADESSRARAAADFLMAQRAPGAVLTAGFPDALRPRDAGEAMAIQLATIARLGPIGGWKIGVNADGSAAASPLPASGIVASPALLGGRLGGVEGEISFRLGGDLPPRTRPYAREEVAAAIASCQAAIEILDPRFSDHAAMDPLSVLADLGKNGGLAVGAPIAAWDNAMFAALRVRLEIDGVVCRDAVASNPGGTDLLGLLTLLANSAVVRATGGLKAGAVATTGSWTGLDIVPEGGAAVARFDGFAPVVVTRRAPP